MAPFLPVANTAPSPPRQSPTHKLPRQSGPTDEHTLLATHHPQTLPLPPTIPTIGVVWGTQDCMDRAAGGAVSTRGWGRNARAVAWRSTVPPPNPQHTAFPPPPPAQPPPPLHAPISTPGRKVKAGGWLGAWRRNWAHRR